MTSHYNRLSGRSVLHRHLVQIAMNYAEMWPLETRWAYQEFSMICVLLGVELVQDDNGIWFQSIKQSDTVRLINLKGDL